MFLLYLQKWSVGRIIDQIAKMCKLRNENNRQSSMVNLGVLNPLKIKSLTKNSCYI